MFGLRIQTDQTVLACTYTYMLSKRPQNDLRNKRRHFKYVASMFPFDFPDF